MKPLVLFVAVVFCITGAGQAAPISDGSPLGEKAAYFERDLRTKHSLDGLYVSIVRSIPAGVTIEHTVNEPGNVIHAGVWTGRYLGGVGFQYAVTKDPQVRVHGGEILQALCILQEVTGKPGLLARGYVKGHGPVAVYERDGNDSKEWHQGRGAYADYRWHGDVSVDNFNAVLYGYAIYFDLAADEEQKKLIAHDVDRLMTHVLDNHCRIIDVDNEPTMWGHIGIDPDLARDDYYDRLNRGRSRFMPARSVAKAPLRASLMLLPDLLIADHITGKPHYREKYRQVVARFKSNPEPAYYRQARSPERVARTNHSSEGQAYEALFNLVRYEHDPELLKIYRSWVSELWDANWIEGNSLFTYMTLALLPEYRTAERRAAGATPPESVPHAVEGLRLANETLARYPIDRVLRPVMNSLRKDVEINPRRDRQGHRQAAKPLTINERPLDNEDVWKGSPYELDGWLKPIVTAMAFSCDDPQVAWFSDSAGRVFATLDRGRTWRNVSTGLMGAAVENLVASTTRTFVIWAKTGKGIAACISRDGGISWRTAEPESVPGFPNRKFDEWLALDHGASVRINEQSQLMRTADGGKTSQPAMKGWRIPLAKSVFRTPLGLVASGPGGAYRSTDGETWEEMKLWTDEETGAEDYLHAYWMGRYYGFVPAGDESK